MFELAVSYFLKEFQRQNVLNFYLLLLFYLIVFVFLPFLLVTQWLQIV